MEEVRGEFDDFQESSRELEAELEAQLEQAESANKDLLSRIQRVEEENESVKVLMFREVYGYVYSITLYRTSWRSKRMRCTSA